MPSCPCVFAMLPLLLVPAAAPTIFELRDGDRVVLLGNTLIEREQRYGYWETVLTSRYPDRNILFRNLGWSGDTVFGEARAGFGSVADGFRHLREHVVALKPTVILVGYGTNEAFDGAPGLPRFVNGLGTLLDTLAETRARIVLLAPLRHEDLGPPLPDPAAQNRNLELYRNALRQVAGQRGHPFVDFYELLEGGTKAAPLTDNGMHLTAYGYWRAAAALEEGLGLAPPRWVVEIDMEGKHSTAHGTKVSRVQTMPLRFHALDERLPFPFAPPESPAGIALHAERRLHVRGRAPGSYVVRIDGREVAPGQSGPEFDQVERLRQAIVAKNRLYFHRWRPQNETYLFGFRKHEQGQNAREIVQFDPLIARAEAEIARLRVPVAHTYEIVPRREKD